MTQTAKYIKRLSELQEGELSRLRRLAGCRLDETLPGFDLFTGLWWNLRKESPATPRREPSWLVAKLFGTFRIPHVASEGGPGTELPHVLGRCEPSGHEDRQRFRARLDALLCSSLSSLEPHLQWGLREVCRAVSGRVPHAGVVEGIDWVRLLDDVSIWDRGVEHRRRRDVRDEWAQTYLTAADETNRRK